MSEKEYLETELGKIKVALDDASYAFRDCAKKARECEVKIDEELMPYGDSQILKKQEALVQELNVLAQRTKTLTDQLTDVTYRLSTLSQN